MLYGDKTMIAHEAVAVMAATVPDLPSARRLIAQGRRFKTELDRVEDHRGIDLPMIVVHGALDLLVPVNASRILHTANPGSRLVILPGAGHCPQLDAPKIIARPGPRTH
ncbi:MAG: alpha/beta fold hydrolase [Mycobacterium sp.]